MDCFLRTCMSAYSSLRKSGSIRRSYGIIKGHGITTVLLPQRTAQDANYSDSSRRTKQRRHECLLDFIGELGMSVVDVYAWAISTNEVQKRIKEDLYTTGSKLQTVLSRNAIPLPLPEKHISSLLISMNATERQVQYLRSYIANIPTVKVFRSEKRRYISNMPELYILRNNSIVWERVPSQSLRDSVEDARSIICVRMKLKPTILAKLIEFKKTNTWPTPPECKIVPA